MALDRIHEIRALLPECMLADWVRIGSRLVRLARDHHHLAAHDPLLSRLLEQARASVALRERRRLNLPPISCPPELPIATRQDEIVAALRSRQVVVIAGETGSGKTTQLPKLCLKAGLGIEAKVACTQPRRVAALSISRRIADELNVSWGREVGCKMRFDDRSSPESYVKVVTDGILLAELQSDPLLCEYNAVIVDEAHERSLNIDFLLGCLKQLLARRKELRLIITSATIDTEAFSRAFDDAPVIQVSGRVYPVEVVYAPLDADAEETGELTLIDAAARATEQVLCEPGDGDALVFLPGERDIRELCDLLRSRFATDAEVIPLFGRLTSGEQQRVFAPCARRKVVVATNIAETSLTIPNIRWVIDSGLARISRYNARSRTRRLPIEPISRSSANQREGRSGRVRRGVCIRLYSEADFLARPEFTQPEIQRANLAEVILRMKAFRLGEIESFPFLNPPAPAAIDGGYKLLQELGALDEQRDLTPLGRELARLPIDPTLGRMLLEARREHATRELLIIASGLSIQDPRERPIDQKDAANAAHRRFQDPRSDFLTLLNLWNAVHEEWETLRTQNQRRKFCRAHFLSYVRMREWQDLYAQLHDGLEELGFAGLNESNAGYDAIHRCILSGLLGHVAVRGERNSYKAAGSRELIVFPGSALYDRPEPRKKAGPAAARPAQPPWIVAGELVETSQLFARTVAGIDPLWILQLAPHLCRTTYHNPHWSAEAGQVLAEERVAFGSLQLRSRKVAFGNHDAAQAAEIFIRAALVEGGLVPEPPEDAPEEDERSMRKDRLRAAATRAERSVPARYAFLEHNQALRHKIETWQTRLHRADFPDLDQAFYDFYTRRVGTISSIHELNRLMGAHPEPGFLRAAEADLLPGRDLSAEAEAFPDAVELAGHKVPLAYTYQPGEEHDGVTVRLSPGLARTVSAAAVEWSVPGLREAQVRELLRALPKSIRRQLMPLADKAREITRDLRPAGESLRADLAQFIKGRYGIEIPASAWPAQPVAPHLQPRIEIPAAFGQPVLAGRDLGQLRNQLEKSPAAGTAELPAWSAAARQWERFGLQNWTIGDLPERLTIAEAGPVYAWPGLHVEDGQVNLRLFRSPTEARNASLAGYPRLVELVLQKDLAWLEKDLRQLSRLRPLLAGFVDPEVFQRQASAHLRRWLLPEELPPALSAAAFAVAVGLAQSRLPALATKFADLIHPALTLRQEIVRRFGARPLAAARPKVLTALDQLGTTPATRPAIGSPVLAELAALMPPDFLDGIAFERLPHLPRYLKALLIRGERAALNPLKDRERATRVAPYQEALQTARAHAKSPAARRRTEEFRWLLEEYKVSLFAQELGTAAPVSPKRLDEFLARPAE